MLKTYMIAFSVVAFGTLAGSNTGLADKTTQNLMQQKLGHANALFAAVVSQQYPQIRTEAEALLALSKASAWHQTESEDFHRYAKNFQESLRSLTEQAKAKSPEGISLGYVRMSLNCTACHHQVRFPVKKK